MKLLIHRLFVALCTLLVLLSASSRVTAYPVTLPPGFSLIANHLAPLPIQSWPGVMPVESQVIFDLTSPYPPMTSPDHYIYDGTDWLDINTANPSVFVVPNGEGAWFFNPTATPISANFTGPLNGSIVQFNPGVPGWHMAGRQTIDEGTFESSFGRSPRDYNFVHVYRWNPATQTYLATVHQFGQAGNPLNRKWSPSAPILNVGEAGWFRLGGISPSSPNLQYFVPGPNFTITGITPAKNAPPNNTVSLRVTGTGLQNGDEIRLRRMQPPFAQTAWTPGAIDSGGYILSATMNISMLTKGYYQVRVRKPSGTPTILNNVFRVDTLAPQLKVNLTGPSMALAAVASPVYQMTVQNTTGSTINGVNLDVVIPSIPIANINSITFAKSWIGPNPAVTAAPPGITVTPLNIPAGGILTITFTITPPLALITSPATTLQLRGRINAPAANIDQSRLPVEIVASLDPNEKHGPLGTGPERYITGLDPSDYTITFENDPAATAPAHVVEVIDQLDTGKFDLTTFELGSVVFGTKVVVPPSGLQSWTHDEPYDVDNDPSTTADNILVRIEAALDANFLSPTYGQVKWKFSSLESTPPHLPVTLPLVGFLPANIVAPEGQGSVSFRVTPFSNLSSGDTIANSASIVFDANPPILTGTWINTIDLDEPSSSVDALPATQGSASFTVNWSGSDIHSGIASYDVYVSDDGGTYTLWQSATTAASATFNGQNKHTYRFYSQATDNVGNAEDMPDDPDTTTKVEARPALQITRSGGNIVLTWGDPAFRLESTPSLNPVPNWSSVPGTSPVTLPSGAGVEFFRLVCP